MPPTGHAQGTTSPVGAFDRFAIGFDPRDRPRLHELWDEIFASGQWSEGELTRRFEAAWGEWNDLGSVAFGSWTGGALAALAYAGVGPGDTVLCPSNTFMATPLSVVHAGAEVAFVDSNREDLCMSFADFERKVAEHRPKAAWIVHIGGHIAFDVERIAALCRAEGIFLIEDCAHAHGADWAGRRPGAWGDAGVYSFYATKTVSTGEGGMLVSRDEDLLEFARNFRNYGKPEHTVAGLNFRLSEFTAAIGLVQTERLPEIVAWKTTVAREHLDPLYPGRLRLPDGMTSGFYKYVVFDRIERSTGKVYDQPCHRIMGNAVDLPNADWIAEHHWCVPLYYRPEIEKGTSIVKILVTGGSGFIGSHVVDKLVAAGHRPRIFDMVPSPYHEPGAVDTYIGELGDPGALVAAMDGCDAVLHLAAVADVNQVTLDPAFAEEVNSRGTLNVLEAARSAGLKRVVYASTIWVYNGHPLDEVDEAAELCLANHLYTATKVAGEMYCTSYAELYGLEYTILRFGIPYGPRARPAAVVPQFVRKALAGEPLQIAGKGDQSRRFVYVEDLAEGCVAGLEPVAANRVYNLVGSETTSVLQIAQVVRDLIGDVDIVHTEARVGDFRGAEISGERAEVELDWRARTSFGEGVRRYLEWYRAEHDLEQSSVTP